MFGFETKAVHAEVLQSGRTIGIGEAEMKFIKSKRDSGDASFILKIAFEEILPVVVVYK